MHLKMDTSMMTDLHEELRRSKMELTEAREVCKTIDMEKSALVKEVADFRSDVELLKQENFSLNNELKMLRHQQESMEYSLLVDENSKIRDGYEARIKAMQEQHKQEIMNIRSDIESLGKEVNDRMISEKILREHNEELRARVETYMNADAEKSFTMMKDVSSASSVSEENSKCTELEHRLNEQIEICRELQEKNEKLNRCNEELEEEKEDLVRTNLDHCSKIEKMKTTILELNAELEVLRVSDTDRQGNSLFAEVEDRRVEAQRKLKMIEADFKSLQRKNEQMQGYNMQLKAQVNSLLTRDKGSVDDKYFERFGMEVQQLTIEKKNLIYEKQKLEEKLARQTSNSVVPPTTNTTTTSTEAEYCKYLKKLLTERELEIKKLKNELWREGLCLADEINRKVKAEAQVRRLENEKFQLRDTILKKDVDINMLRLNTGLNVVASENAKSQKVKVEKIEYNSSDNDEENRAPLQKDAAGNRSNDTNAKKSSLSAEKKPAEEQPQRITAGELDQCAQQ